MATALRRLEKCGSVVAVSRMYETAPVEVTNQPWFLNCAARLETALEPETLMAALLEIEASLGRARTQPKGPRIIDLDILLYDQREIHGAKLDIPHPAMHRRRFVLAPLAEIAPLALHPAMHRSASEMLEALQSADIVRVFTNLTPLDKT